MNVTNNESREEGFAMLKTVEDSCQDGQPLDGCSTAIVLDLEDLVAGQVCLTTLAHVASPVNGHR